MPRPIPLAAAFLLLTLAAGPALALELENAQTPATSGTTGGGDQGRLSGANLSTGGEGPESGTKMTLPEPVTRGMGNGGVQAGGEDATRELYEH